MIPDFVSDGLYGPMSFCILILGDYQIYLW